MVVQVERGHIVTRTGRGREIPMVIRVELGHIRMDGTGQSDIYGVAGVETDVTGHIEGYLW